jgi:hypothetical protein
MAKNVKISKTVYNKDTFNKVIDREFKSFTTPVDLEQERTIEQFFSEYERLYLEISPEGDNQSHRYLINKSSELVDYEKDTTDIQPLLDEIAQLRRQILDYQQQLIDANIAQAQQ